MKLVIPEPSLACLIGLSGSGRSTSAARHFRPTEVVSSDACRAIVADDENDQSATRAAFRILQTIVEERLRARRLTVVDATNVQPGARRPLVRLAKRYDRPAVAIVFDLPPELCFERNGTREGRNIPASVIDRQYGQMKRSLMGLAREGFRYVYVLDSPEAVERAVWSGCACG
jgi:protein phosphatase